MVRKPVHLAGKPRGGIVLEMLQPAGAQTPEVKGPGVETEGRRGGGHMR